MVVGRQLIAAVLAGLMAVAAVACAANTQPAVEDIDVAVGRPEG